VRRARMGIQYGEIEPEIVAAFQLPVPNGIVIGSVMPDSPAARAGLRQNDLLTHLAGAPVPDATQLRRALRSQQPGNEIEVTVRRGAQTVTTKLLLAELLAPVAAKPTQAAHP
jgi:S1-C subfamily serine protease